MLLTLTGVENEFMPWLMEAVEEKLQKSVLSRNLIDELIREVVRTRFDQFAKLEAEETLAAEAAASTGDTAQPADSMPATAVTGTDTIEKVATCVT
jgi:hypothetical protein